MKRDIQRKGVWVRGFNWPKHVLRSPIQVNTYKHY